VTAVCPDREPTSGKRSTLMAMTPKDLNRVARRRVRRIQRKALTPVTGSQRALLQIGQLQLAMRYRELAAAGGPLPSYRDVGFGVYCDADEDGILLFLLAVVGADHKVLVDLGSASADASNSSNLVLHHGWTGLLVDGDADNVALAERDYADRGVMPPTMVSDWITAENVNELVTSHVDPASVDLLSIDIDGNDYWVWKALDVIRPRVAVIEYQDIIGPERAVTIPYDPTFVKSRHPENGEHNNYVGASLRAMVELGRDKGYRLVATNAYGFNAFFVRDDLAADLLPEIPVEAGFPHPWNRFGFEQRWPLVQDLPWQEV